MLTSNAVTYNKSFDNNNNNNGKNFQVRTRCNLSVSWYWIESKFRTKNQKHWRYLRHNIPYIIIIVVGLFKLYHNVVPSKCLVLYGAFSSLAENISFGVCESVWAFFAEARKGHLLLLEEMCHTHTSTSFLGFLGFLHNFATPVMSSMSLWGCRTSF